MAANRTWIAVALCAAAVSCKKKEEVKPAAKPAAVQAPAAAASAGSCTLALTGECWDYTGKAHVGQAPEECKASHGQYAPAACPTQNRLGSCVQAEGKPEEVTFRYYQGAADALQSQCVQGARRWIPG